MRRLRVHVRDLREMAGDRPRGRWGRVSRSLTVWLVVLWLMVFGSLSWIHLISGVLVALLVQVAFPLPHMSRHREVHPLAVGRLLGRFLWDLVRAGFQVAWVILRGAPVRNAILRVDLRSSDPVHMTLVAAMNTLIPGTVVVRIDRLSASLYLHVLDVDGQGGPDAMRAEVHAQEDRVLRAVVPLEGLDHVTVLGGEAPR